MPSAMKVELPPVHIDSAFDSGNIISGITSQPGELRLKIRPDVGDEHLQWFHYRVANARGRALVMHIENAGKASYLDGWTGYRACGSYDRTNWFRCDTTYEDGQLTIRHRAAADHVYFAYFAPYSLERHRNLIARADRRPRTFGTMLGATVDGRGLDMLQIGEPIEGRKRCWIIARQHPGETMAEWLVEGLLERLQDTDDPLSRSLLERAVFYVVPNMNPDGSFRGHLRTNAAGANLNREWAEPTMERSPEVLLVRNEMDKTGVDFCLDVHGDEALPYNFIAGSDGVEGLTERIVTARRDYEAALVTASPDFQTKVGYPKAPPGKANMTMATNQIAKRFGALAMTLEQPFKDTIDTPDEMYGWSPPRCRNLGRANLNALHAVLDSLG